MKHIIPTPVPMRIKERSAPSTWVLVVAIVVSDDENIRYIDAHGGTWNAAGNSVSVFIPGLPDQTSEHGDWYPADNVR